MGHAARQRCVLAVLVALGGCAADDPPPTGSGTGGTESATVGEASTGTTPLDMPPAGGCACFDPPYICDPETDCGSYISYGEHPNAPDSWDPCDVDPETGEIGNPEECEALMAGNALVVDCVLAAVAEAEPVRVRHIHDDNSLDSVYVYRTTYELVDADVMLTSHSDDLDLCTASGSAVHAAPDLAPCDDWDCILAALQAAPLLETCAMEEECDG